MAEFEALKSEWEKVRDQQIRMIQDKEQDLERLKEELSKDAGWKPQNFFGDYAGTPRLLGKMTGLRRPGGPRGHQIFEQKSRN